MKNNKHFELVAERDYLDFSLREISNKINKKSPIEIMIDRQTGYDDETREYVKWAIKRIKDITILLNQKTK